MRTFILRRVLHMIPLVVGITFMSFGIIQLAPGDYFSQLALNPQISPETIEQLRRTYGLDQPLSVQYLKWLWAALRFDFGYSFSWHMPVIELIRERALNTMLLSVTSSAVAWLVAIPIGIYAAVRQYSLGDKVLSILAFVGMSMPSFFAAFLLLYLAAVTGWFPIGGATSAGYDALSPLAKLWDRVHHLILPVAVLSTGGMAGLMRLMRGNLLEILKGEYITTARSKGLGEGTVILKHAVRNALNPFITLFGYQLAHILGGAALVEIILSWPGLGSLMLEAVMAKDLYLVMGSLYIGAILLILGNLVADLLLVVADPRIRYDSRD